jgi:hypothetical protein
VIEVEPARFEEMVVTALGAVLAALVAGVINAWLFLFKIPD